MPNKHGKREAVEYQTLPSTIAGDGYFFLVMTTTNVTIKDNNVMTPANA